VRAFGRFSMDDAFDHLNGVSTLVWPIHSILVLIAIASRSRRRTDVFTVIMIGPVIAATIILIDERWTAPNWFGVVAVCSIGSLVGSAVGFTYWVLRPRRVQHCPPLDDISPEV
jgi:hypothetical protein